MINAALLGRQTKLPARISVARDDLAAMAGTATESVIRCLSDFKDMQAITMEGRDILVLSKDLLESVS